MNLKLYFNFASIRTDLKTNLQRDKIMTSAAIMRNQINLSFFITATISKRFRWLVSLTLFPKFEFQYSFQSKSSINEEANMNLQKFLIITISKHY